MQTLILVTRLFAQQPRHVPPVHDEPLRFFDTPENIIFYVVLPAVVVILYFIWRYNVHKMRKNDREKKTPDKD